MPPGRNEPCTCGSGKKYKRCCGAAAAAEPVNPAAQVNAELRALIGERKFHSLEELQAFVREEMHRRNAAPRDDFHGLSPEQVHRLLHFPFESPEVVRFHAPPDDLAAQAPMVALFEVIADALGEAGVKATATGKLPRALCRKAFEARPPADGFRISRGAQAIQKEEDFFDLHVARIVAEAAGLLKRAKGRFSLTAIGIKLRPKPAAVFDALFQAYLRKYNWAHGDYYDPLPFIQQAGVFTLFLLAKYGSEWRPAEFYGDAFVDAFPAICDEVRVRYSTAEREAAGAYSLRSLERFAADLGLVERRETGHYLNREVAYRATPLLAGLVTFCPTPDVRPRVRPSEATAAGVADTPIAVDLAKLTPLRLREFGTWHPEEVAVQYRDEGADLPAWLQAIVAQGPRSEFEMENVIAFDPEGADDVILRSAELRRRGRVGAARRLLLAELAHDPRALDAHAHLGNLAFDADPAAALGHYETGVRIGELTAPPEFRGLLPWGLLDNRPFLRCLHGYGLCLWRLGRVTEARAVFSRMLWLNPNDNQGARFLLDDLAQGKRWEEVQDD